MAGFIISNTISNIIVCGLWTYISAMFAGPLIATWVDLQDVHPIIRQDAVRMVLSDQYAAIWQEY